MIKKLAALLLVICFCGITFSAYCSDDMPLWHERNGRITSFRKDEQYAVYSGPGTKYLRGAVGKASVSTNGPIVVYGIEKGYALVQYATEDTASRFGYITANALSHPEDIAQLSFPFDLGRICYTCAITDDPLQSKRTLTTVTEGSEAAYLADLGDGWIYVEVCDGLSNSVRGFIPREAFAFESNSETAFSTINDTEYTYLACTWNYAYNPKEPPPGTPEGLVNTRRVIQMLMPGSTAPAALLLPDECGEPENFKMKGIRITVDAPIDIVKEGNFIRSVNLPNFIVPKRVEIVGDVFYGCLTEIGTDYIVIEIYGEQAGDFRRFIVTDETMIWIADEPALQVGNGVIVIGNPSGVALSMHLSNG